MRAHRFPLFVLIAGALATGLVACDGDDGGSEDEDQITEVIETSVKTTDPADCTKLQTQAFVEQSSFETGEAAVTQCEQDVADTSDDPDSVEVSNVEVDGDAATADVSFVGGVFDGSTVSVSLVKEGDQWKLDRIEDIPEFNREAFDQAFTDEITAAEDVPAPIADCIVQVFGSASDEQIKTAFLSGDAEQLNALFAECLPSG